MPIIDLTAFFRDDDGHGWSEGYQIFSGETAPPLTAFINNFDTLMRKFRLPMLAGDGFYLGCRASFKLPNGRISAANKLSDLALAGTKTVTIGGNTFNIEMNLASDACKTRFQNAASTANSDVYLRGIWDEVFAAGQLDFGSALGKKWKGLLDNFTAALITNGYGWRGINPDASPRGNVNDVVAGANGRATFTLEVTNGIAIPAITGNFSVRFSKINNSKSILNRTFVCTQTDLTHVTTVKAVAFGSFDTPGRFVLPIKGFIAFDHTAYNKAATRKTGRPFGVGRGRLSAAVLS